MNFKFKSITLFIAISSMIMVTSCSDDDEDDVAAPVITNLEVGDDNSLMATVGSDLHIDAEVAAEGLIEEVEVELHSEDGTGEDIEAKYTEYSGQKNADFHKHIDIPATATPGEYHFHLKVTDQEGQVSEVDAEVMIEQ